MSFQEINVREFSMKPFKMIGDQWMLVTAGDQIKYNTMTASWGGIGVMWGKNVAVTVIRPQRYTKEFVESHDCFTLSFYPEEYKKALSLCGSKSGREIDKAEETGLDSCFRPGCSVLDRPAWCWYAKSCTPSRWTRPGL